MKKLFYFLCAACLLMTACDSDKDENNGPEPYEGKLVRSRTIYKANEEGRVTERDYKYDEFEYDNQSRIVKIKTTETSNGALTSATTTMTVSYSKNLITTTSIQTYGEATYTAVTKITMKNGIATSMEATYTDTHLNGIEVESGTLTYTGNYMVQTKVQGDDHEFTTHLTWYGGNVTATKDTYVSEGYNSVSFSDFEYNSVERKGNIDINYLIDWHSGGNLFGWFGKLNANLKTRYTPYSASNIGVIATYEYEYDADGYVTQIISKKYNDIIFEKIVIGY